MRTFALLIVCITILLCGSVVSAGRRSHETPQRRRNTERERSNSFGGRILRDNEAEWEVSIMLQRKFLCAGTLLRTDVVLTAAECVQGEEPADLLVRAGTLEFKKGGQVRKVRQTIYHPKYDESKSYNVAIMELLRPFNESAGNISTISLPDPNDELPSNVTVYGWGLSTQNGGNRITKLLRFSKAIILPERKCSRYLRDSSPNETVFCSGGHSKIRGVCNFGVGSPAIGPNNVQYGIVTESSECTDDHTLTVYANILAVRDWIENTLENDLKSPSNSSVS